MKRIFIGQIVEWTVEISDRTVPQIGKVVDIALQYAVDILLSSHERGGNIKVMPVVHFVGESTPRTVRADHLREYTFDK